MVEVISFILTFSVALCTTLILMPLAHRLSLRWDLVSIPGGRRLESTPMPKLGGVALVAGFVLAAIFSQFLPIDRFDSLEIVRFAGLITGTVFLLIVGVLDDAFEFSYTVLFTAELIAFVIAIASQIFIEYFNNPFTGELTPEWSVLVTIVLTMFWLLMMMNTVNFLDGLDGLAAGVAFIAGLMLFINSAFRLVPAQTSVSLLPLALMGACAGFLLFNFHPARIYMGGSAICLGYILGTLSIIGGAKMATILLVMGLPLVDLTWQAVSRLMRRRNPFRGDRGHMHFRLQDSELFSHRQIVLGYYTFCGFFGMLTILLESQLFKFIAFGVMIVLVVLGLALLTRYRPRYEQETTR